jgi:hypothetical protein
MILKKYRPNQCVHEVRELYVADYREVPCLSASREVFYRNLTKGRSLPFSHRQQSIYLFFPILSTLLPELG